MSIQKKKEKKITIIEKKEEKNSLISSLQNNSTIQPIFFFYLLLFSQVICLSYGQRVLNPLHWTTCSEHQSQSKYTHTTTVSSRSYSVFHSQIYAFDFAGPNLSHSISYNHISEICMWVSRNNVCTWLRRMFYCSQHSVCCADGAEAFIHLLTTIQLIPKHWGDEKNIFLNKKKNTQKHQQEYDNFIFFIYKSKAKWIF